MRSEAFIREPRDGRQIHVPGGDILIKISSRDTDGAFTLFEAQSLPQEGPPLHLHREQDETFRILEGQFLFEVDGQEILAGPGATVFARPAAHVSERRDRARPHGRRRRPGRARSILRRG
jgi:mannose-6-phosphate isomerase-like protein (cupin superfamily)